MSTQGPSLIDKKETARRIGGQPPVSVRFVEELIARGILPKVKLSHKVVRIPAEAVEKIHRQPDDRLKERETLNLKTNAGAREQQQ